MGVGTLGWIGSHMYGFSFDTWNVRCIFHDGGRSRWVLTGLDIDTIWNDPIHRVEILLCIGIRTLAAESQMRLWITNEWSWQWEEVAFSCDTFAWTKCSHMVIHVKCRWWVSVSAASFCISNSSDNGTYGLVPFMIQNGILLVAVLTELLYVNLIVVRSQSQCCPFVQVLWSISTSIWLVCSVCPSLYGWYVVERHWLIFITWWIQPRN